MSAGTWYTVLLSGSDAQQPPRGPWRSREDADAAIQRWRNRVGPGPQRGGGQNIAPMLHAQLAGPYPTRAAARLADIAVADGVPRRRL